MLLAITFHHHSEAEGANATYYCYDCAHHIHHDGHLTSGQSFMHECVLCCLQSLPYLVPSIIHIAAFIAIAFVALDMSCPFVMALSCDVRSTRAPPVL